MDRALRTVVLPLLVLCSAASGAALAAEGDEARAEQVVLDALASAGPIESQARALVGLAWPADAGDPAVMARARREIISFGQHGMAALRQAVTTVRPEHLASLASAIVEAYANVPAGNTVEYLPALESVIWFGTREARTIAIPEVARFRYRPALLTVIDAAIEDPALETVAVPAVAAIRDDRARFWLAGLLSSGDPARREMAATALARIGGRATEPLKEALRSPDAQMRVAAARALLPVATVEDVTALHEYVARHGDDDPATIQSVKEIALMLEEALEAQRAADSASPPVDF